MSLSIAWSRPNNKSQSIAFSDSRGYITLVNLNNNQILQSFKAHNFEAWIVTFNHAEPNILYTG